jgi:hypothetical protein
MLCGRTSPHSSVSRHLLIKKKDIFDPIEDNDGIDWKYNPFDADSINGTEETPDQLMSQITFEGSP